MKHDDDAAADDDDDDDDNTSVSILCEKVLNVRSFDSQSTTISIVLVGLKV